MIYIYWEKERLQNMQDIKFTDNEIKAIYNLYIYGFEENEIASMANGKKIYDIINMKIEKMLDSILEYTKDSYYSNHICSDINMETILQGANACEKIIDSLKELQKKVKQDIDSTMSEVLIDNIENVIKIINNIEKVQQEYNILKQKAICEINNTKIEEVLSRVTYIATLKEDRMKKVKVEPIITKEQWQEVEKTVRSNN